MLINLVSCGGGNNTDSPINKPPDTTDSTKPGTPRNITAIARNGVVTVSWLAPNTGAAPNYYTVDKSNDNKKSFNSVVSNVPADIVSIPDSNVLNNTTYLYRVVAGNDVGVGLAAFSNTVTPEVLATEVTPKSVITSPSANAQAQFPTNFGSAIAFSENGQFMAIAERLGNPAMIPDNAVQIYIKKADAWQHKQTLISSSGSRLTGFGSSIAFSSDNLTLAIAQSNDNTGDPGSVQLFTKRQSGDWQFKQLITASIEQSETDFGAVIRFSSDGKTLFVSESQKSSAALFKKGSVVLYHKVDTNWTSFKTLTSNNAIAGTNFGASIALSLDGFSLAIGETGFDSSKAGNVQLYKNINEIWTHQQTLTSKFIDESNQFGRSVAFSADSKTIAIADSNNARVNTKDNVQLFRYSNNSWLASQTLSSADKKSYGHALAFSPVANLLLISEQTASPTLQSSNQVTVFRYSNSQWLQSKIVRSLTPLSKGAFGFTIVFDRNGSTVVIGEPQGNLGSNTGDIGVVNFFEATQF